jgi:antitoxin ParD1/3/4
MASSEMISVELPSELVKLIRSKVADGEYANDSDVVRAAMAFWSEQTQEISVADLRAKVQMAIEDPRPSLDEAEVRRHFDVIFNRSAIHI